jgi:hypothetical protein
MASTTNEIAAMTPTGGEGEWIADPLDTAISILIFISGIQANVKAAYIKFGAKQGAAANCLSRSRQILVS